MSGTALDGPTLLTGVIQDSGKLPIHGRRHRDHLIHHIQSDSIIPRNELNVTSLGTLRNCPYECLRTLYGGEDMSEAYSKR